MPVGVRSGMVSKPRLRPSCAATFRAGSPFSFLPGNCTIISRCLHDNFPDTPPETSPRRSPVVQMAYKKGPAAWPGLSDRVAMITLYALRVPFAKYPFTRDCIKISAVKAALSVPGSDRAQNFCPGVAFKGITLVYYLLSAPLSAPHSPPTAAQTSRRC